MKTNTKINNNSNKNDSIKLELSIEAKKIKNSAGFKKRLTDLYAIVSKQHMNATIHESNLIDLGRTETIENSKSPIWIKRFEIYYTVGQPFMLHITICDEKRKSSNDKRIGSITFPIRNLNIDNNNKVSIHTMSLNNNDKGDKNGLVTLRFQNPNFTSNKQICFDVQALDLAEDQKFFAVSDPFLEILREEERDYNNDESWYSPAHRTEYMDCDYSPH